MFDSRAHNDATREAQLYPLQQNFNFVLVFIFAPFQKNLNIFVWATVCGKNVEKISAPPTHMPNMTSLQTEKILRPAIIKTKLIPENRHAWN